MQPWMLLKDLRIALNTAMHFNLLLPGVAQAVQLYGSLLQDGHGDENISVLMTALEKTEGATPGALLG